MAFTNTSVTTTAGSIYTASSASGSIITTIHLCNYTNAPVTANIYAVQSGGTPNNGSIIYSNVSITAYNTLIINTEKFILETGDKIYANVSANASVTATVSAYGI